MDCAASQTPTRRETRRHNRREAILDVAAQSFLDNGYAATTMSGIAATLGGSKGTLWNYFPSKEQLFAAVLDRATAEFREELALILTPGDAVNKALRRFCRQFLRQVTKPEAIALYRLVVGEANRFPEMGRIFFDRAPGRVRELLAGYLAGAMRQGVLRDGDPQAAALQITGLCLSGCHMELLYGAIPAASEARIEQDVDQALATFLRAYAP